MAGPVNFKHFMHFVLRFVSLLACHYNKYQLLLLLLPMSLNPHQLLEFILFSIQGVARGYGKVRKANLMAKKEKAEGKQRAATLIHDDHETCIL